MSNTDEEPAGLLRQLMERSYTTYQSRVKACERLARQNTAWNVALMASAVAVAVDSVVLLVDDRALGDNGDAMLVCASIITLFISASVAGMNLAGKSRDMFTSYRRIQRLSAEAERAVSQAATSDTLTRLSKEYDDMLDNSDNHRLCDYLKVEPDKRAHWWVGRSDILALAPPVVLIVLSASLVAPAFIWML